MSFGYGYTPLPVRLHLHEPGQSEAQVASIDNRCLFYIYLQFVVTKIDAPAASGVAEAGDIYG